MDTRLPVLLDAYAGWIGPTRHAARWAGRPSSTTTTNTPASTAEQGLRRNAVAVAGPALPGVFGEVESVHDLRGRLNDGIERQLKGYKPWQRRGRWNS